VSRKNGGDDALENLVPACKPCNSAKNHFDLKRFREWMRTGGVRFSEKQIEYLRRHGIELPNPEPFIFWFEIQPGDMLGYEPDQATEATS